MNNVVLQKILHGYQLIDMKDFDKKVQDANGFVDAAFNSEPLNTKNAKIWESMFLTPRHFDANNAIVAPIEIHKAMKQLSKDITQAAKFYVNLCNEDDMLKEKELKTILPEIEYYAPYPKTFLQIEMPELIYNILCEDTGRKTEDTNEDMFTFTMLIYSKETLEFQLDLNKYDVVLHKDVQSVDGITGEEGIGGYTFWIQDSVFKEMTDLSASQTAYQKSDAYSNTSLNAWLGSITSLWQLFMIYLTYPAIAEQKNVKGRTNEFWYDIPMKKYTTTEYRNKAMFEHKELVIKMFDDETDANGNLGRSKGTAFHSVRKHLRRYSDGKISWVKAHFRGSKEHGLVNKDYTIKTS